MDRCTLVILALLIPWAVGLSGCSDAGRSGFVERISNGVTVRSYRTATPPETDPYRLGPPHTFGADQGPDTYLLSSADYLGESADGRVYLLDIRSHLIHIFAGDATHLGAFGGLGAGPGEFSRGGLHAWVHEDEILVWDRLMHRLSIFDHTNVSQGSRQINGLSSNDYVVPYLYGGERRYLAVTYFRTIGPEIQNYLLKLVPLTVDFEPAATLLDTFMYSPVDRIGNRSVLPPFTLLGAMMAIAPDLPVALWWPGAYRIDFLDPWSGEQWATELPIAPRPVTRELREWRIGYFSDSGLEAEARRGLHFPTHLPHIGTLTWSEDGRLWVMDSEPIPEEAVSYGYNVFSREGEWLFRQTLPVRLDACTADGIWVRGEREDGAPILEFHPFVKEW